MGKPRGRFRRSRYFGLCFLLSLILCVIPFSLSSSSLQTESIAPDIVAPEAIAPGVMAPEIMAPEVMTSEVMDSLTARMRQGIAAYASGQFSQAIAHFQTVIQRTTEMPLNQALALSYLSLAYHQQGDQEQSQQAIQNSLALLPSGLNPDFNTVLSVENTEAQRQVRSRLLNSYGQLLLAWGQPEAALMSWDKAAEEYQSLGDQIGVLGVQVNKIAALRTLGFYQQAQRHIESVMGRIETQPDTPLKASAMRSLGNILRAVGQLNQSQTVLHDSLMLAKQMGHQDAIAATLISLGNTEQALGDRQARQAELARWTLFTTQAICPVAGRAGAGSDSYAKAMAAYQESAAMVVNHSVNHSANRLLWIQSQLNALDIRLKTRDWPDSKSLHSLLAQLERLSPSRPSVLAHVHFAEELACLHHQTSKPIAEPVLDWAEMTLTQAIQKAEQLGDRRALSDAVGNLGWIQELRGQSTLAIATTQRALRLAQQVRALELSYRWHWQLARLSKGVSDRTAALDYYQAAVDNLAQLRQDLLALDPSIQFSFRERIEPLYRQFVDLLLQEPQPQHLQQARDAIEALQLAELDNFFQDACSNVQTQSLDNIIDQQESNSAVLYAIILPEHLDIVLKLPRHSSPERSQRFERATEEAVSFADLRHYTIPVSAQDLQRTVRDFRRQLGPPYSLSRFNIPAQQLYTWLVQPLDTDLQANGIDHIVFVLDGVLRNVPMAALYDGEQYLSDRYAISISPGLRLLAPDTAAESGELLAAGISQSTAEFPSLPNVETELEAIAASVPNSTQLLNQQFTKPQLKTNLQRKPISILHLATHGQFSSQADKTFILTHNSQVNIHELGDLLRQHRQWDVNTAIDLLVLSACQTALGDERAALGLAGVAIRAGARSTLASLWSVNDRATALLMAEFYRQLYNPEETHSKAEALQLAQRSVRELNVEGTRPFAHPLYWSAFVLLGNGR